MGKWITGSLSAPSYFWRLSAALVLGGLVGFYTSFSAPGWLDVLLDGAALLLPPLVHLLFDQVRKLKLLTLLWALAGALALALLFVLIAGPGATPEGDVLLMLWLAPISASFTVGSVRTRVRRKWRLAVLCGMVAWVGVGLHNLLGAALTGVFAPHGPFGRNGLVFFGLFLTLWLFGLLIAVLTGLLGAAVHAWLQRRGRS
jgi:hypothetical protein